MTGAPGLLTDRVWIEPVHNYEESALRDSCARLDICEGVGRILASRDLVDASDMERFLEPSPDHLHDPFLMRGMDAAVSRIENAIDRFEKVVIYGDYDVDGTASTALLYNYLKRLGARVHYFIPDRLADGFGLSVGAAEKLAAGGADLIITVDTGSTAIEAARFLADQGVDLLITDHHQVGPELPACVALVNPHQPGCPYPFKDLSATGVAYKLLRALEQRLIERNFWDIRGICHTSPDYYLDLVALATVADMSPLVGENRVLVKMGLEMINDQPRPGLSGLIKECNVRFGISPSTINFKIAPRINALGRIGDPKLGIQVLLARSYTEGRRLARQLSSVNRERQEIERQAMVKAVEQADRQTENPALVLVGQDWHQGVIGIICTRLAYQHRKPTVVLTLSRDGMAVGSARGCGVSNVLAALESCGDLLERFGGHTNAAGLALHPCNVEAFRERFLVAVESNEGKQDAQQANGLPLDAWVGAEDLHDRFISEISRLCPFGHGNPEPVLGVKALRLSESGLLGREQVKLSIPRKDGRSGPDRPAMDVPELINGTYDIAFTPKISYHRDGRRTELKVCDVRAVGS